MSAFAVTPNPLNVNAFNLKGCELFSARVQVYITGGIPPYSCALSSSNSSTKYSETTSQSTVIFQNVMFGQYTIIVTDANMQTANSGIVAFSSGINANAYNVTQPLCNNGTGSVELSINSAPYSNPSGNYSYSIDNGNNWISFSGMSTTVSNLPAGSYDIGVRDNSSYCFSATGATITAPDSIIFTANLTQPVTANDKGSAALTISGGTTPYYYDINKKNNYVSLATNKVIADLPLGNDTIYIKDANGCVAQNTESFLVKVATTTDNNNAFASARNVSSTNNAIQIEKANGKHASLYDLNGTLIYNEVLNSDNVIIPLFQSGIYLVNIEGKVQKVMVK